jgi:hypothetical protein
MIQNGVSIIHNTISLDVITKKITYKVKRFVDLLITYYCDIHKQTKKKDNKKKKKRIIKQKKKNVRRHTVNKLFLIKRTKKIHHKKKINK